MSSTEWSRLEHAYGPASDIPDLLTAARSAPPPADVASEPWFSLWSALYHQDDIYSASLAAVPELVAIAAERGDAGRGEALLLAASIELARHEPDAPELPDELRGRYEAAVRAAGDLAAVALAASPSAAERERLEIAAAVFRGDHERARALLDASEDEDA